MIIADYSLNGLNFISIKGDSPLIFPGAIPKSFSLPEKNRYFTPSGISKNWNGRMSSDDIGGLDIDRYNARGGF
jgi:hypothetical protein